MDFFYKQESLTVIQWTLRGIVAFFFLLIAAKLMGQRSISQLRLLDFIMALLLGNILAHPLSDEKLGMKGSIITMTALVFLYSSTIYLSIKWDAFKNFFDPSPTPLIKNGQIIYKNLARAKISIDFLLSELRKQKIDDIQKVAVALWEPSGTISVFLQSQHQPVTPADLQLVTEPFSLPRTIIKEGKIDFNQLNKTGKDQKWLKNRLKTTYNAEINNILLATIDNNDKLMIFSKADD